MDMQLTNNFNLSELTASDTAARHGWTNDPGEAEMANLRRLAGLLEEVRSLLGKPIIVSSGYRSLKVNAAVGSKETSQHVSGCAADIKVSGMVPSSVVRAIIAAKLPYDQVIQEFSTPSGGGWTHISVPNTVTEKPRLQALIIDSSGTRLFA